MKPDYWRQLDFFNPDAETTIPTVIGVGHTGSFIAVGLAAMGFKRIKIVDFDVVEEHNLPNQFFSQSILANVKTGELHKVDALKETINYMYPNVEVIPLLGKIEDLHIDLWNSAIVFSCVDSIETREYIINQMDTNRSRFRWLIDSRTGGEFYNVFTIDITQRPQIIYYKKSLEGNVSPLRCTGTAIIDVSYAVAATCLQRMRQCINGNSKIVHSFHDCTTSLVSYMYVTQRQTSGTIIRTSENIMSIKGTNSEETKEENNEKGNTD